MKFEFWDKLYNQKLMFGCEKKKNLSKTEYQIKIGESKL